MKSAKDMKTSESTKSRRAYARPSLTKQSILSAVTGSECVSNCAPF